MNKYKILIVDADIGILESIGQWLEFNGHQVIISSIADDVTWISQWQWQGFDCVITGIYQPGLDGLTFTELIRDSGGPPVIVMSGYGSEVLKVKALEMGAFIFLPRPLSFKELLETVEECCNKDR